MRASSSAPSSWLSTRSRPDRLVRNHAEALQPAFDFGFPFLKGATRRGAEHVGLRRGFERGGRDRATFPVVGLFQIGRHAARDPREKDFGGLGGLGGVRDGLAHGFAGERQRGLADLSLPREMEIQRPRRPPAAECRAARCRIALLAKTGPRGQRFPFGISFCQLQICIDVTFIDAGLCNRLVSGGSWQLDADLPSATRPDFRRFCRTISTSS